MKSSERIRFLENWNVFDEFVEIVGTIKNYYINLTEIQVVWTLENGNKNLEGAGAVCKLIGKKNLDMQIRRNKIIAEQIRDKDNPGIFQIHHGGSKR